MKPNLHQFNLVLSLALMIVMAARAEADEVISISWATSNLAEHSLGNVLAGSSMSLKIQFELPSPIVSEGNMSFSCGCMSGTVDNREPSKPILDMEIQIEREAIQSQKKLVLSGIDSDGKKFEGSLLINYTSKLPFSIDPKRIEVPKGESVFEWSVSSGALSTDDIDGQPSFEGPWIKSLKLKMGDGDMDTHDIKVVAQVSAGARPVESALHYLIFKMKSTSGAVHVPIMMTLKRSFSVSNSKILVKQNPDSRPMAVIWLRGVGEALPKSVESGHATLGLQYAIGDSSFSFSEDVSVTKSGIAIWRLSFPESATIPDTGIVDAVVHAGESKVQVTLIFGQE